MRPHTARARRLRPALATAVAALALASGAIAAAPPQEGPMTTRSVYDFTVRTIEGRERSLGDYRGQVLLVVNTASRCGFTPQYASLEKLHREYHDRGFEVLAFPANDFMNQEPGSNEEIRSFCSTRFGATFPLFAKISVKGRDIAPLYDHLTRESAFPGAIGWNFTKFLVGRDGRVVARFDPITDPVDRKVTAAIERALAGKPPVAVAAEGAAH